MKEWLRLRIDRRCGFCGQAIDAGELVLAYGAARKLRCVQCAGEAPPEILPVIQSTPMKPLDMARIGLLALDWRPPERKPFVEREPGEEG